MKLKSQSAWYSICLIALIVVTAAIAGDLPFECVITVDRTNYAVGETPKFTVRIKNNSTNEVVLVGALDGSGESRRFPRCKLEIFDAGGNLVTDRMGFCGNMNVLRTADFVAVPCGKEFDPFGKGFFAPYEFHKFPVRKPGVYTVHFSYSTNAKEIQEYFGDERMMGAKEPSPEIRHLLGRVPKLELRSNELKLMFK